MGKLNIFQISFKNNRAIYCAGDNVEGHVTVELIDQMCLKGVRLVFEGEAHISWTEGSGDSQTTHSAHETYFDQEALLQGSWPQEYVSRYTLPAGRHIFPFKFILPHSLPPSFEGNTYCVSTPYVRYSVKAKIDESGKSDHTCKRIFTVISTLDLNSDEKALLPAQGEENKTLCCLCCASGPITANFHIDHKGYVPGEPINIFASIENNSNRRINKSYIALKMEIKMYTTDHKNHHTTTKEVDRVEQGPIDEGRSFSWEGQQFVVPPLPPSYLTGCNIIDINYILEVSKMSEVHGTELNVEPSGPAIDLTVPLEIVIGTIPLQQVLMQYPPHYPPIQPCGPEGCVIPAGTMYPCTTVTALNLERDKPASTVQPTVPFMQPCSVSFLSPPSCYCRILRVNHKPEEDERYNHDPQRYAPVYAYYSWGYCAIPVQNMY